MKAREPYPPSLKRLRHRALPVTPAFPVSRASVGPGARLGSGRAGAGRRSMTAVACCRRLPGERGVGPHGQPEGATQGSAGPDGGEEDEGGGSARRGGRRRHAEPAVVLAHGGGRGGRQEEEVSARRRAQRLVKALWFPRLYKANKSQSCVTIVLIFPCAEL